MQAGPGRQRRRDQGLRAGDGITNRNRREPLRSDAVAGLLVLAMVALLLVGWGAGAVSRSALQGPDLDVVREFAAQRTAALTAIVRLLSLTGSVFVIAPLAVICGAALYRSGRHAAAVGVALSGGAGLIFNVDKLIVGRPRPTVEHLVATVHSSFPSGHATLSAAFSVLLLLVFLAHGPGGVAAITAVAATSLLVIGIALSRAYLGVHYSTDVVGGTMLGRRGLSS